MGVEKKAVVAGMDEAAIAEQLKALVRTGGQRAAPPFMEAPSRAACRNHRATLSLCHVCRADWLNAGSSSHTAVRASKRHVSCGCGGKDLVCRAGWPRGEVVATEKRRNGGAAVVVWRVRQRALRWWRGRSGVTRESSSCCCLLSSRYRTVSRCKKECKKE